ncbi:hypothetical protein LSH36_218g03056 [Paralvinella palmiformis]|uniref:EF-hand domain-containing protein n=1 Tax=Paralvinella palmiformis TaxID=53620 RepID=A0AAD9N6T2_9ANNE|nr:hypothetical protein LSH36_218g03056 [Paralvinella palmiformis]
MSLWYMTQMLKAMFSTTTPTKTVPQITLRKRLQPKVAAISTSSNMTSRSRPTSARPSFSKRSSLDQSSYQSNDNLEYECKAAYLVVFDSMEENIETREQLIQVLQQAGRNPTKKCLRQYWTNDTDSISFSEFVDICRKVKPTTEDELLQAFKKIDINGDGYIDNSELKKVLTTRGDRMTTQEIQEIIDEVDENKDGKLDYKEFSKMMLNTQEQCKKLAVEYMEKKTKKKQVTRTSNNNTEEDHGDKAKKENREPVRKGKDQEKDVGKASDKQTGSKKEVEKKEGKATELSEDDDSDEDDSDDIVFGSCHTNHVSNKKDKFGSQSSLKSGPAPSLTRTSPKVKERSKSPVAGKDLKLPKPKRLKDWNLTHSKGCFYFDDDKIISHQYEMRILNDTSVWITVEPITIRPGNDLVSTQEEKRSPVDTMLFILRSDDTLVSFTEQRDVKGKYAIRCDLEKGVYKLIPFTTGCRFKPRMSEPTSETKLVKKSDDSYVLTKAFKEALTDIFEMCDLDGNGYLNRSEFNYFNLRTSGEEVTDKEWEVVESTMDLKNGEITRQGFVKLNQMEAEDNEGDTEELWVTLMSMGFNKTLKLDEACPFVMDIYSETCVAKLKVIDLEVGGKALDDAVIDVTKGKGEVAKVRNMRDLFLHTYMDDFRACMVLENKSHHNVKLSIDSSKSENCTPNTDRLELTITVPSRSSMIAQHLMPTKETKAWLVRTQENVIK